ncbi:MAG: leucine-rich repeat domain-containing protein [Flavobacteriales bacterium]|nr:leucine-rich repeat domain-containing protein [Flavobacteriales bacterium]
MADDKILKTIHAATTELDLSTFKFTRLPEAIREKSKLTELKLTGVGLKELPKWIGELQNLRYLWLDENDLTEIPEEIGKLTKLGLLRVNRNPFKHLPDGIGNLSCLQELWLENEALQDLPEGIGRLKTLVSLFLSCPKLHTIPEALGSMTGLTHLYFNNCVSLKTFPSDLSKIDQLQYLQFWGCELKKVPDCFSTLPDLEEINLENNQITDIPSGFQNLDGLKVIRMKKNKVKSIPSWMANKKWKRIDLSENPIKFDSFPENFNSFEFEELELIRTPAGRVSIPKGFSMPRSGSIYGLQERQLNEEFQPEIEAIQQSMSAEELQQTRKKLVDRVNRSLRKYNGKDGTLKKVTDYQVAFLKLLYEKYFDQIKAEAQAQIDIYFEERTVKPLVDIDKLRLPDTESPLWEIVFNDRNWSGPVVCFDYNGWEQDSCVLVG